MKNAEDPTLNINVRLLRRVQKAILTYPSHYDQSHWPIFPAPKAGPKVIEPPCGTTMCILGWAEFLVGEAKWTSASTVLGLTHNQIESLGLNEKHYHLTGKTGAKKAAAAIDRLIETGGKGDPWKKGKTK